MCVMPTFVESKDFLKSFPNYLATVSIATKARDDTHEKLASIARSQLSESFKCIASLVRDI